MNIRTDGGGPLNLNFPKAIILLAVLAAASLSFAFAFVWDAGKWLSTAGLLFDVAAIVQLEISGLFDRIARKYEDMDKYPGGPPSHFARRFLENTNLSKRVNYFLFFDLRTGFYLLIFGCSLQLAGVWA